MFEPENVTETSAKIRWRKSIDPEFEKYTLNLGNNILFDANSDNIFRTILNVNDTVIQLNGLTPNKDYIFRVSVYDKYLAFSASNIIGFTANPGGLLPTPEIVNLFPEPEQLKVTINWIGNESSLFAYYFIYVSTDSLRVASGKSPIAWEEKATKTSYAATISRGVTYFFRVSALNVFGKQSYSKIRSYYLP